MILVLVGEVVEEVEVVEVVFGGFAESWVGVVGWKVGESGMDCGFGSP